MKNFILAVAVLWNSPAILAAPTSNKLIKPDSVTLKNNGKVEVIYTLPCVYDDSVGFVMTNDDSGDQVVAVGVVYSQDICKTSTPEKFMRQIDPKIFGYSDASFEPMDVR